MRYWVLKPDGSGADGPFEIADLKALPGFGPISLVAPDSATAQHAWKPASQFPELLTAFSPPPLPLLPSVNSPRPLPRSTAPLTPVNENLRSIHALGLLAYNSGDYRKAVEYLDKVLVVDADDAEALFYRGMAGLHGLGRDDWWKVLGLIIDN